MDHYIESTCNIPSRYGNIIYDQSYNASFHQKLEKIQKKKKKKKKMLV